MSKARSMYAGSPGIINGANSMLVQIGDKLQGLPPTTNKPAQLINTITTKAEGDKRSVELKADAQLYEAQKEAEAVKVQADADAYAIKIKAKADAEQTRVIAEAISNNGQPAINYEIMKRQVDGLAEVASSNQTKTLVVPTDITKALGTLELFLDSLDKGKTNDA